MSGYSETTIGCIPSEWTVCSASSFCTKVTDGTHDSPKRQQSGKYLVTSKHIKGRQIDRDNAYLIAESEFNKINERSKVNQWDVIVSMIGEYCGFCYVERSEAIDYAVKNVGIFKTSSRERALWLYYYCQSKIGRDLLEKSRSGTSQPYISLGALRKLPIVVPNRPEERDSIISVIESIDDKVDLLRRQNKTLEAMAETLFRQWFVEEADDDWSSYRLGDLADHLKKNVVPAKFPDKMFRHYSLPSFDAGMRPTIESGSQILSNKYGIEPWTLLVSKLNPRFPRIWPIGNLSAPDSICSTEFQVFKPKRDELFGYLYFLLRSDEARDELAMAASGTSGSHQRVKPEDILNLMANLPSLELAEHYSRLVMPSIRKMFANIEQAHSLESLRDTLLPKLMSGEVRVEV